MANTNSNTGKEVLNITYDGNDNETYTIFSNGKELGELSTDEDTVVAICNAINATYKKGYDPEYMDKLFIALTDACERMERCRKILQETEGDNKGNWGMLDTEKLRDTLTDSKI